MREVDDRIDGRNDGKSTPKKKVFEAQQFPGSIMTNHIQKGTGFRHSSNPLSAKKRVKSIPHRKGQTMDMNKLYVSC